METSIPQAAPRKRRVIAPLVMFVVDRAELWALYRNVIPGIEPGGTETGYKENQIRGTLVVCSEQ